MSCSLENCSGDAVFLMHKDVEWLSFDHDRGMLSKDRSMVNQGLDISGSCRTSRTTNFERKREKCQYLQYGKKKRKKKKKKKKRRGRKWINGERKIPPRQRPWRSAATTPCASFEFKLKSFEWLELKQEKRKKKNDERERRAETYAAVSCSDNGASMALGDLTARVGFGGLGFFQHRLFKAVDAIGQLRPSFWGKRIHTMRRLLL